MNPGAIVLGILVLRYLCGRGGKGANQESGSVESVFSQDISARFVLLASLFVGAYACLFIRLWVAFDSPASPIGTGWIATLLKLAIAGGLPLVFLRTFPPWLAWRIFRRLNLFPLSRFCFWFTPGASRRDLEGFAMLLRASRGIPPAPPPAAKKGFKERLLRFFHLKKDPLPFAVDTRTVTALALAAEVRGDHEGAERHLRAFDLAPPGVGPYGILCCFAIEELVHHAAGRGDWDAVRRRVRLGSGRGMPLLRRLAGEPPGCRRDRVLLWFFWLVSPLRIKTLPLLRATLNGFETPPVEAEPPRLGEGVRIAHVRLLHRASEGLPVSMDQVFALAEKWDREMTRQGEERLLRRGMDLGVRDLMGIAEKIREGVLDELEEMAVAAEGEIPYMLIADYEEVGLSCAARLACRIRNRLYDEVSRAAELFAVGQEENVADERLPGLWDGWLALHGTSSRLLLVLGVGQLDTLWYGGLRDVAWNNASQIYNSCGKRTAWMAIVMFHWVAEIAELVGDEEGVTTNRNNLKICGYDPSRPAGPRFRRYLSSLLDLYREIREKIGVKKR